MQSKHVLLVFLKLEKAILDLIWNIKFYTVLFLSIMIPCFSAPGPATPFYCHLMPLQCLLFQSLQLKVSFSIPEKRTQLLSLTIENVNLDN